MAKPEREFFAVDGVEWTPAQGGLVAGLFERILAPIRVRRGVAHAALRSGTNTSVAGRRCTISGGGVHRRGRTARPDTQPGVSRVHTRAGRRACATVHGPRPTAVSRSRCGTRGDDDRLRRSRVPSRVRAVSDGRDDRHRARCARCAGRCDGQFVHVGVARSADGAGQSG